MEKEALLRGDQQTKKKERTTFQRSTREMAGTPKTVNKREKERRGGAGPKGWLSKR